jgi:hypothetical protein
MVTMRLKIIILIPIIFIIGTIGACAAKTEPPMFPPVTAWDVPAPAPVPWPNITIYTEQTYKISTKVGKEFAIGLYATMLPQQFMNSYDQNYLSLINDQVVEYQSSTIDGTEWFLFKAIKKGNIEISFGYPIEYRKIFKITIN